MLGFTVAFLGFRASGFRNRVRGDGEFSTRSMLGFESLRSISIRTARFGNGNSLELLCNTSLEAWKKPKRT